MIKLQIQFDKVNKLCAICEAAPFDVDIVCDKYVVDGTSAMGVASLIGRTVTIHPVAVDDQRQIFDFYEKLTTIGAYQA